jgi:hypothetical protein
MVPEDTNPVGVVNHEPSPVTFLELDEAGEIGHIALGRIQSLDDDQRVAIPVAVLPQNPLAAFGVVVSEASPAAIAV